MAAKSRNRLKRRGPPASSRHNLSTRTAIKNLHADMDRRRLAGMRRRWPARRRRSITALYPPRARAKPQPHQRPHKNLSAPTRGGAILVRMTTPAPSPSQPPQDFPVLLRLWLCAMAAVILRLAASGGAFARLGQ